MGRNLLIRSLILSIFFMLNVSSLILAQHRTTINLTAIYNQDLKFRIEENVGDLLTEFNEANLEKRALELDRDYLTQNAIESIDSLWSIQSFYCNETKIEKNLVRRNDGYYEIRNIPLILPLENGRFNEEEGILILTPSGKIDDLYFGLEYEQYNKLLKEGKTVIDVGRRKIILNYVEIYRTAYNRKDIDYIQKVFSDDAIIIVGRVMNIVQDEKSDLLEKFIPKKMVELIRKDKTEYIIDLKEKFRTNKYFKVLFDEIEIYQHPKFNEIYGVTLLQHWTSSNYSDQGYLFLMFDFKDEDNPIIWVRTWQLKEFTPEDEVIGLGIIEIE